MAQVPQDWKVPPKWTNDGVRSSPERIRGWAREAREQGDNYLKSQRAYPDIDRALDLIAGADSDKRPKSLSRTKFNKTKRGLREIIASEANLRPLEGFKSDNRDLYRQAEVLNKLARGWWFSTFADRSIRKAVQWAAVGGTAYCSPVWEKDFWLFGRGDVDLRVYGPRDVLPVQIGPEHDLQRAYAVTIRVETPIAQAVAQFPTFADQLAPTRARASWLRQGMEAMGRFASPALNLAKNPRRENEPPIFPTIDLHYTYILDLSVNMTGKQVSLGKPGTSWNYSVPTLGADIDTGMVDTEGRKLFRNATEEDAQLYPLRRLIVWTERCLLSDDSSPWWHGKVPLVSFSPDDWPWDFLGYSLAHDCFPIQASIENTLRAIDDAANVRLRPPLQYDRNVITKTFMDRFDPRQPGQNVGVDLQLGEPIKGIMDPKYYDTPAWMQEYVAGQERRIDYLLGVQDIVALAKARQVPAADSVEKILEAAGPLMMDISRGMERSLRDLGEMLKVMFFQFYSTARKVQVLGPDMMTEEDYDFDPGNLVPSHLPGEDKEKASAASQIERAKAWHNNFYFHITPHSAHSITQTTRKLMLLQWQKMGNPMDPWTLAEDWDIPNFGPPPAGTSTVMERWVAWLRLKAELAQELGGGEQEAGGGPGRKPSGHAPPKVASKDGGTRTTITESR